MSNTANVNDSIGFFGACFFLFFNFGSYNYDLYDALIHWLMK